MHSRLIFKIAAIRERMEFCEAERHQLMRMLTNSRVNLAWITERMERVERDLQIFFRDLQREEERLASDQWS
jgi:hypothetical protein